MIPGDASNPRASRAPSLVSDRAKILIMGIVLGLILLAYFWPDRTGKPDKPVVVRPPMVDVTPYQPDPKILADIRDDTPTERGGFEGPAWAHLLKKSYNVSAGIAAALRLPERSADIPRLRNDPASARGKYIWFKGKLEEFEQKGIHPLPRAASYEGRLRTADGDQVIFWVSKPLPDSVLESKNKWVRVEGFFMKIVDKYYVDKENVLNAPLIIGPRVEPAYPDWEAVEKLDPMILSKVKNGTFLEERKIWINDEDMETVLVESQDIPLWHLASFAMHEFEKSKETGIRHTDIFEVKDQYTAFKLGTYDQGARLRLRGTFIQARVYRAKVNPAGIEYWTEAWMRIPRMGAKLIPIWVPGDIGPWDYGESMDLDAFFFKNRAYEAIDHSTVHTPQFVAGGLQRFKMKSHPVTFWVGIAFAAFVAFVAFLFFNMNRRSRTESEEYKAKLVERRRRRRSRSPGNLQT